HQEAGPFHPLQTLRTTFPGSLFNGTDLSLLPYSHMSVFRRLFAPAHKCPEPDIPTAPQMQPTTHNRHDSQSLRATEVWQGPCTSITGSLGRLTTSMI